MYKKTHLSNEITPLNTTHQLVLLTIKIMIKNKLYSITLVPDITLQDKKKMGTVH